MEEYIVPAVLIGTVAFLAWIVFGENKCPKCGSKDTALISDVAHFCNACKRVY